MNEELQIFFPMRRQFGFCCGCLFMGIAINIYYLMGSSSFILIFSLIWLFGIFIFLFIPLLKNQKLLIGGDVLVIFSFGKKNSLRFSEDLEEIVMKNNEILSYRFRKNGKYYQVSPGAYYESEDLKHILRAFYVTKKATVSIVQK